MNDLKIFEFESKEVRTIIIDDEPYFVAKDLCNILGLTNTGMAISRLEKDDVSLAYITDSLGREQQTSVVTESGLYDLVSRSEKPEAKVFRKWINREVLPSIRKTGKYEITKKSNLDILAEAQIIAMKVIEERDSVIAVLQPKAEVFDQIMTCPDAIDLGSCAKVLNMGVGRNQLFKFLKEKEILMDNNQPYQNFVNRGYFRVIEQKFDKPDGIIGIGFKTLVHQKGLDFIRKRLLDAGYKQIQVPTNFN